LLPRQGKFTVAPMTPTRQGSIRLFRFAGIDLYLHWSWFLVAAYEVTHRAQSYSSVTWNVIEYLTLFLIVTMHEFGHALACRSVGGEANQIVLWPLGGVAYVAPPQRPGATLWSIAAGPLVNVVLLPVSLVMLAVSHYSGWDHALPNLHVLIRTLAYINGFLLIFNLLPIYPLDGGQIVRSLLWFFLGRARSLMVATIIGFVGVAGLIGFALWAHDLWFGVLSVFILLNCWGGLQYARALTRVERAPRHEGFACPACHRPPPQGSFWVCGQCRKAFDTFATQAVCPHCGAQFAATRCLECGCLSPLGAWAAPAVPPRL
jgi:Zn-dependent protease